MTSLPSSAGCPFFLPVPSAEVPTLRKTSLSVGVWGPRLAAFRRAYPHGRSVHPCHPSAGSVQAAPKSPYVLSSALPQRQAACCPVTLPLTQSRVPAALPPFCSSRPSHAATAVIATVTGCFAVAKLNGYFSIFLT